jgi:hypothetical protein
VEHRLVAPLVAVLLEKGGDERQGRVGGMDRGLGVEGLEMVDDRSRVLQALALGRDDERNQGELGVLVELRLVVGVADDPLVRDLL